MTKKQLWESKLSQRCKSLKEAYHDMSSATMSDGTQVMATGSTRSTRTYNYEDVIFRFGNKEGRGSYGWQNRPWQRFDFASALQQAMIDAGVDKEFARECIEKSGSLRSAIEFFAKNYKVDKKEVDKEESLKESDMMNESHDDKELLDAVMDSFGFTEDEALEYIKKASDKTKRELVKGFRQDAKKNFYDESVIEEKLIKYAVDMVHWEPVTYLPEWAQIVDDNEYPIIVKAPENASLEDIKDELVKLGAHENVNADIEGDFEFDYEDIDYRVADESESLKEEIEEDDKEEIEEVGSFEFCVMDKYGNNIDCFAVEEDAIMFAKKKSNADRVLLVTYGPEDEYGDTQELSAETIWSVDDNEDDDKVYQIKYWLTEEDREEGFSDIFIDSFDSKQEAIMKAKKMVDRGDVASVEVFDADDVTEQPVYFYDGNEENCSKCGKELGKDGRCYNSDCDEYDPLSQYFDDGDKTDLDESAQEDRKELDYLWEKEKMAPLDKFERFRLQELIQKYGRPDEQSHEDINEEKDLKEARGAKIASIIASALNKQGGHGPMSNEEVVADGNTITLVSQAGLETYKFNDDGSVDNLSIDDMIKTMLEDGDIEESEIEDIREEYSHFNSIKDLLQSNLTWFMNLPEKLIIKKVKEILGEEKDLEEARGAGKGQKLDKYYRMVDNLYKDNLSKEEIEILEKAKSEVEKFEPKSEYEKKDKKNLLDQIAKKLKDGTLKEAIDLDKHVWEGWTVQDFIDELEPLFDQVMSGRSWQKPFKDKAELKAWCIDNQPYYKRYIPGVVEYFFKKMKKNENLNEKLVDYDPAQWEPEDIELHKSINWEERNWEDFVVTDDSFETDVMLYGLGKNKNTENRKTVEVFKTLRANPIYPPYYGAIEQPFIEAVGPMFDGNKHGKYSIHDRYETQEHYDFMFD